MKKNSQLNLKPRVLVFMYNSSKIGGPTTAMRLLMNSWLKEHYNFKEININGRLGKRPQIKLLMNLIKEIKAFDPDIIHLTGLQLHGFYASLASRLAGYKNILTVVRGSTTDAIEFPKLSKLIFGKIIEPLTIRMSKVLYTVCNEMAEKDLIKKNTKTFGGIVHNAIPVINLNDYDKNSIRKELKLSHSDVLVVYTGRVTKEKGLHYALDAFRSIEKAKFIICGTGVHYNEFITMYAKEIEMGKVFFLGDRDDIINILSGCDIFLFPTLHENLSNSLLEACAVGLPSIATNVGGNPEVIRDGINGILVEPHDSTAIVEAVKLLIDDEKKRKSMGIMAQRIVNDEFSQEKIFSQVDKLYKMTMS